MSPNISWEMLGWAGRLGNLPRGKSELAWPNSSREEWLCTNNSSWDEFKMKQPSAGAPGVAANWPRGQLTSARRNCPRGQLDCTINSSQDEFKVKRRVGSFWRGLGQLAIIVALLAGASGECALAAGAAGASLTLKGSGFVLDSSHPLRPGDARRYPIDLTITAWYEKRAYAIAVADSGDTVSRPDVWYVRSEGITRVDTTGTETQNASLGDVSAVALAAIESRAATAAGSVPANGRISRDTTLTESNWTVRQNRPKFGGPDSAGRYFDVSGYQATELRRSVFDERMGDGLLRVNYTFGSGKRGGEAETTSVHLNGREVGRFVFESDPTVRSIPVPDPGPQRIDPENRNTIHQLAPDQVHFTEIAPHLFTVDLDSLNTRVTVAEFSDSLAVIEGAFGSGPCDVLAAAVRQRFHKPVRMFAFSHLHGQYSGGTRSWVHEGATVVVPPSTEPLIHQMVDASFASHPDALQREPRKLKLQTVPQHLHVEDSTNALDIYNVTSGHTDEYFLFHFPRQRVLLTGDLMFLRPGKPFGGRSKMLAQNIAKLGLAVDTYVASWPLHGFGTLNVVTAAEFAQAAADTAQGGTK